MPKVAYFELGARDSVGLREFYASMFDWNIDALDTVSGAGTEYAYIQPTDDGIGGGIIQTQGDMPPNYVMVYISVDDLQSALDKVVSLGGQTAVPPTEIPGGMGHFAVFMDPAGNVMGLHTMA